MIKLTFQTKEEFHNFVNTISIFTHLRAYNGQCNIWKDEDIEFIKNLNRPQLKETDPELWKKSVGVYLAVEEAYGKDMDQWRDWFGDYSIENLLHSFGFDYDSDEDCDGVTCVTDDLAVNVDTLKTNDNYPTSFPVVVCIEGGESKHDGPECLCIYPEGFKGGTRIGNYDWLKKNAEDFWTHGKGTVWGN